MPTSFPRLTASVCALVTSVSVCAAEPVETTADITGVWQPPNMAVQFQVRLEATESGATLTVSRTAQRCRYVLAPVGEDGVFESFSTRGSCDMGSTRIRKSGSGISMLLPQVWGAQELTLSKISGPDLSPLMRPSTIVRGVSIGMPLDDAIQSLREDGMNVSLKGRSDRVLRAVAGLRGTYAQATASYRGEYADLSAAEESIGVFALGAGASNPVVAVLRHWAPAPLDAPTIDGFIGALENAYGPPNGAQRSGGLQTLTWYFDRHGELATGAALQACQQRAGRDIRVAAILFDTLTFSPSSGRGVIDSSSTRADLSPKSGCGYTLRYDVRKSDNGSLKNAEAVFYDHRAIANQIWAETVDDLDEKIQRALKTANAARTNESKL